MIISEEQARLAAAYLRAAPPPLGDVEAVHRSREIPRDLMERVRDSVATLPDVREDRVAQARALMAGGCPDSGEVAGKLLARAVSDSLR